MILLAAIVLHPNIIFQTVLMIVIRLQNTFFNMGTRHTWASTHGALLWQETRRVRMSPLVKMLIPPFSLGGNFAAVLTMRYASNPLIRYRPRLQVLIYPVLQFFDFTLPSYQQEHFEVYPYSMEHVLSLYINQKLDDSIYRNNHTSAAEKRRCRPFVDWNWIPAEFRRKFKPQTPDCHEGDPLLIQRAYLALHPDISPLLVDDSQLAKLPRTYILTTGHDRLRDEGWIYAERVRNAGVPVDHDHEPSAFHASITNLNGMTKLDIAHKMVHNIVDYLKPNL